MPYNTARELQGEDNVYADGLMRDWEQESLEGEARIRESDDMGEIDPRAILPR